MVGFKVLLLSLVLVSANLYGQSTGEVMFVAFNADESNSGILGFSFVPLVNLAPGITIHFSDNEWNGSPIGSGGAFNAGEGGISWQNNTGQPIMAGVVITILNSDNSPTVNYGTITAGTITPDELNEVLYMFLGSNNTTPTLFLSAIANDGFSTTKGRLTNTGLTSGTNAISISSDEDVMVYAGTLNFNGTVATATATIANSTYWDTDDKFVLSVVEIGNPATDGDAPNFPDDIPCNFYGSTFTPVTYYSRTSGAWDDDDTWTFISDGSGSLSGTGLWPRRIDHVVIKSAHSIVIDHVDDNKNCGMSADDINKSNVGNFTGYTDDTFYHTGDITIEGTLTSSEEMMLAGYTLVSSGGTFDINEDLINLGYLEIAAGSTFDSNDDLILTGNSTTIINNTSTASDDIYLDYTDATLCGEGIMSIGTGGADPTINYLNGATVAQVCEGFQITCSSNCPGGFPIIGTGGFGVGNTGPGGVGAVNGTSDLNVWLMAGRSVFSDAGITPSTDGEIATQWNDFSGNNNHAISPSTSPTFDATDASINNTPSINFAAASSNAYNLNTFTLDPSTSGYSIISAFNCACNTGQDNFIIQQKDGAGNGRVQLQYNDSNGSLSSSVGGSPTTSLTNYTPGTWTIFSETFNLNGGSTDINFYKAGTPDGSAIQTPESADGSWHIGRSESNDRYFNGSLAEVIIYNHSLNDAKRIIVENYLSSKYNIPLTSNDIYTMDDPANGNYDYDVTGIGMAADGSYHKDAVGQGIIRIFNPNHLGNGEFMLWGHNNTSPFSVNTVDVDNTLVKERLSRVWRVSEQGDVGTVSISVNFSEIIGTFLGSDLWLLVSRDDEFFNDNDVTPVQGTYSGNTITFSGVNLQHGDRLTIGNSDAARTLPIELAYFEAKAHGSDVIISWKTISEVNNDYFTIERSKDLKTWDVVLFENGNGNSQELVSYQRTDNSPYPGRSYYRLKQTDYDGKYVYFSPTTVEITGALKSVILYPNPTKSSFTIAGAHTEPEEIKILDISGREVNFTQRQEGETIIIDIHHLKAGLYLVKVLTEGKVLTKKVLVE